MTGQKATAIEQIIPSRRRKTVMEHIHQFVSLTKTGSEKTHFYDFMCMIKILFDTDSYGPLVFATFWSGTVLNMMNPPPKHAEMELLGLVRRDWNKAQLISYV